MATLGTTLPTMADLAKRMDPNGGLATIAEILNLQSEILQDIPWMEGNLPTGHRTTLRTSLPVPSWRRFNEGVPPIKSTTGQIDEVCGMMEAYAEVDKELLKLYGNQSAAFRASENSAIIEGMNQEFTNVLFYGDLSANPEKFNGFATRINDVNIGESSAAAKDGAVVDAGGTGSDNASAWLVGWGGNSVHGIYPRGMEAGLQNDDLGEDTKVDSTGNMYQVLRSHFMWKCGIAVRDWRYVIRIANIDVSDLLGITGTQSAGQLLNSLIKAIGRRPINSAGARWVIYANRTVMTQLQIMSRDKAQYMIGINDVGGRPVTSFLGIPIRLVDKLLNTEAQLT